jgi:hypothetical protein
MRALELPPVLAITDAQQRGEVELLASLERALARGLRLVMVREKQMPREQLICAYGESHRRCRPFAARVIVNGDVSVASDCWADGVHLPRAQLLQLDARPQHRLVLSVVPQRTGARARGGTRIGLRAARAGAVRRRRILTRRARVGAFRAHDRRLHAAGVRARRLTTG